MGIIICETYVCLEILIFREGKYIGKMVNLINS